MTEGDPRHQPSDAAQAPPPWDTAGIGEMLGAAAIDVGDVALGPGKRYEVGAPPAVCLDVFPTSAAARITTDNFRLELYRQAPPEINQGVLFTHDTPSRRSNVFLSTEGEVVVLFKAPDPDAQESSQQEPDMANQVNDAPDTKQPVLTHPGATETVVTEVAAPSEQSADQEQQKQERVTLHGRAGRDPHMRTTPNGKVIAQFPLGVRQDDGKTTTWHTIVTFDQKAAAVQETVKKGVPLQVIGYKHVKEQTGKDGKPKTVEEIYAVVVKPR